MKIAHTLTVPVIIGLVALAATTAHATEGVSPGALDRMAQVNNACPTFSWGEEDGAAAYELVAYVLPEDASQTAELTTETEALFTRVAGSATSWTPSADQCFAPGGRYVWFVRSVTELAGDDVVAASEWSAGRYFTVPAAPSPEEMQRALAVLRRWDAANGDGSPTLFAATATVPDAGTDADADAGSAAPKSVPTASAAIRGEHPDTSGEKYGVVGTSASYYGAGVAAANLYSGPDLVLDGSADGEPDARLYEWGLDRESATDWSFRFFNSGAGAMTLDVEGTVAATGLDCPDCVTSAEIANMSVTGADLADGSVTGAKIGAGAVDSGQIRGGAVENTHLADNAVTAAKIQDGAVRNADLGNNAVTTDKIADGTIGAADLSPSLALDADTLDGEHGAFYRDAGNLNVGTLSTSRYSAVSDLEAEGLLQNASGDIAQNNGTRQINLNADLLDGEHASSFQREVLIETSTMDYMLNAYIDACAEVHSVTVTVPGPGTVTVDVDLHAWIHHETGYEEMVQIYLEIYPDNCYYDPHQITKVPSDFPTDYWGIPMSYMKTFQVSSAGAYTYFLNARCVGTGCARTPDTDHVKWAVMRAMYFPD